MKLKCIKSYDNTGVPTNLIVGKLYDLQDEDNAFYYLTEDEVGNKRAGYYKDKFVKVNDRDEKLMDRTIKIIQEGGIILLKEKNSDPKNHSQWYMHQHTNIAAGLDEMKLGRRPVALEMHNLKWAFAIAKLYDCKVVVYYPNGKIRRE